MIAARPVRFLVLALIFLLAVGFLALGISSLNNINNSCPAPAWHGTCATSATNPGQGAGG